MVCASAKNVTQMYLQLWQALVTRAWYDKCKCDKIQKTKRKACDRWKWWCQDIQQVLVSFEKESVGQLFRVWGKQRHYANWDSTSPSDCP